MTASPTGTSAAVRYRDAEEDAPSPGHADGAGARVGDPGHATKGNGVPAEGAGPAPRISAAGARDVETPSGKGAGDENFPVGSFLLARDKRPHVMAYYRFARAADDIADNPALAAADKVARLDAFEASLRPDGPLEAPRRLAETFAVTGIDDRRGRDLLSAFRQDATKLRYADFGELVDYCTRSADPVGRFLLDLHGEDPSAYPASDALCTVLQILNHLQDCQKDCLALDRVYLPLAWLEAEGIGVEALAEPKTSPPLRRVLDRTLEASAEMIAAARRLPHQLADRRMAAESETITRLAERLHARLRKGDPLATRVALSKSDFARAAAHGVLALLVRRKSARGRA